MDMGSKRILATFQRFVVLTAVSVLSVAGVWAQTTGKWSEFAPASLADTEITGTGTAASPYVINSASDLAYFGSVMKENNQFWELGTDIDLHEHVWDFGTTYNYDYFIGNFRGGGHTISGLVLQCTNNYAVCGFFGVLAGTVENLKIQGSLTVDGISQGASNIAGVGLLAGMVNTGTVTKCKVVSGSTITINNCSAWQVIAGVGGIAGHVESTATITDSKVENINIYGKAGGSSNGVNLSVGGLCGTVNCVPSISRCGVKGANIDIQLDPSPGSSNRYNKQNGHISVGGVIGSELQSTAMNMPEDITAYNCKLRAPYGSVGPVAGSFLKPQYPTYMANDAVTNQYSGENGVIPTAEQQKTSSWMYSGYQLGVDADVIAAAENAGYVKNGDVTLAGGYMDVGDAATTLPKTNVLSNKARRSRTLLWYTGSGRDVHNGTQQYVYPNITAWDFPIYFAYFMQGYNAGTYVSSAQAEAFLETIGEPISPSSVEITDLNDGRRGTWNHDVKVKVTLGTTAGATWSYSINGEEKATGIADLEKTLSVAPEYGANTVIAVTVSDGTTKTFTLREALLATKLSETATTAELIEADNKTRGTEENPYYITTEKELRLWSDYSRMSEPVENGIEDGKVVEDDANHFNTAWFELGADINMTVNSMDGLEETITYNTNKSATYRGDDYKKRHGFNPADNFEPICGLTSVDNYDAQHTFRGHFDGKGHTISNLHQIWRGGTLPMNYSLHGVQSWGLFGVVGGGNGDDQKAVIQNVIIKDAKFEHDVYNGSFLYHTSMKTTSRSSGTQGTSCAVGVLAGMVTKNAVIQNVDAQGCQIYAGGIDQTTSAYNNFNLIDIGWGAYFYNLWVGGIVGRVQYLYDTPKGDLGGSVKLQYLASDIDIDVFPIRWQGDKKSQQLQSPGAYNYNVRRTLYNVGGIVGSMATSAAAATLPVPEHVFFTGQIRAMGAIAGPTFGFVSYSGVDDNITTWAQMHEHYVGKNNLTNAYFNNYYLRDTYDDEKGYTTNIEGKTVLRNHATAGLLWEEGQGGAGATGGRNKVGDQLYYLGPITTTSPSEPLYDCTGVTGVRTIQDHSETGNWNADYGMFRRYQGVNQGIWKDWTVEDNNKAVVDEFCENGMYIWKWDAAKGRVSLTNQNSEYLDVKVVTNQATAELKGINDDSGFTYAWYDKCGVEIKAAATSEAGGTTYTVPTKKYDQYFYSIATNAETGKSYRSKMQKVEGTLGEIHATITQLSQVTNTAVPYTHQSYIAERMTQEEYYATDPNYRLKTPVVYFANFAEYKEALDQAALYVDDDGNAYYNYPQGYFNNEKDYNAAAADDYRKIKNGATYYSYREFLDLDYREGSYDSAAENNGYTYKTINGATGLTWPNKGVTLAQFNALSEAERTKAATVTTRIQVTLDPTHESLIDAANASIGNKYEVYYKWYYSNGTPVEGAEGTNPINSILEVTKNADKNVGSYYCDIKVTDKNYDCSPTVIFADTTKYTWGIEYIYVNPDKTSYNIPGCQIDATNAGKTANGNNTGVGDDSNDGKSPYTPVATWSKAYSLLAEDGDWDDNQIVLIGTSSQSDTDGAFGLGDTGGQSSLTSSYNAWLARAQAKHMDRNATITGKTDNANYNGHMVMGNCADGNHRVLSLFGDTRFKYLTFENAGNTSGYGIIACQYYSLEMGEGLKFDKYPTASSASAEVGPLQGTQIPDFQIFGGCNNDSRFMEMNGSVNNFEKYLPHPDGFNIIIKSGFYSAICVTGRQSSSSSQNGIAGTPNMPVKCNIIVDIDRNHNNNNNEYRSGQYASYDIGAILAGNHEGAQYGDVNIIVRSGIIGRIASGTLGNKRGSYNFGASGGFAGWKSYYGTNADVPFPFDTYFGRCNILVDPESSESNNNGDINKRVVVSEIYGGALGRHMGNQNQGFAMSTFYGKTNITINGGTFDLNTAGTNGGKYGLAAFNNVINNNVYQSQPGIYGSGAGGFNGIGVDSLHTNDVRLPYWDNYYSGASSYDHTVWGDKVVKYGDYNTYKNRSYTDGKPSANKVYIKCRNLEGTEDYERDGEYTMIDPAETSTTITINGGDFFPSELPAAQGCGIYGGGNGYVNTRLINGNSNGQTPNPLAGSILGVPGKNAVTININGGTFNCDVFGGAKGNNAYYNLNNSYNDGAYTGKKNFDRNARILGNVELNINGGTFLKNIYGSGYGYTTCPYMAEVIGNTTVNISKDANDLHIYGDVYGGGYNAMVTDNTEVNLNSGLLYGSVFGGGNNAVVGEYREVEEPYYNADQYEEVEGVGKVLKDDAKPSGYRNVMKFVGKTSVFSNTENVKVYGNIFGGGNLADVNGNTYVAMSAGAVAGDIFGGGNGSVNGNVVTKANVRGSTEVFLNGYSVLWNEMWDATNKKVIAWDGLNTSVNVSHFVTPEGYTKNGVKYTTWKALHNVYGGGNLACDVDSTASVTVTKGMTPLALLKTDAWQKSYYDNDHPHFYVFGGGLGENTTARNTKVVVGMEGFYTEDATTDEALAKPATVFVDEDGNEVTAAGDNETSIGIYSNGYGLANYTVLGVLGGGYKGTITNNTDVTVGGSTFIHRVYGGGYGDETRANAEVNTTLGKVGNSTVVTANGARIYGDIFGGGARGDVVKTTKVGVLRDCKVYGSVYGGGDVANVGDRTGVNRKDTVSTVVIAGGTIFRNVFAGGSQGAVNGSSLLNVADSVSAGKTIKPYIYGDVYGGGEKHNITGSSFVTIDGGYLAGNIFGGGLGSLYDDGTVETSANVADSTNVTINGGSILWSAMCNDYSQGTVFYFDNSASIPMERFKNNELLATDTVGTKGFFDWVNMRFVANHNVYGGGNKASVSGKANVTMNHGLLTEGLQNYDANTITPFAICWFNILHNNKSYPQFSVLGGGYGKHTTVESTDVKMLCGVNTDYVGYEDDFSQIYAAEQEFIARWNNVPISTREHMYGGTNVNAFRRYRSSRYAWSGGIHNHVMANVIGGSWAGKVTNNTKVTMDGASGCRNVFGGGVGMATTNDNDHLGEVGGTTNININGAIISGDVFGGGAGIESADLDKDGTIDRDYINVARVVGGTKITIDGAVDKTNADYVKDGTLIFGSVTGGGDVANVGAYASDAQAENGTIDFGVDMTNLTIKGGLIFSQVYAGGNGRKNQECVNYKKVGAVYGNTNVTVQTDPSEETAPWLWNRVYGGGKCGTVYGNTNVNIQGGYFGYNIFGGGFGVVDSVDVAGVPTEVLTDASVTDATHVNISGGEWCVSQRWITVDENGNDVRAWAPQNVYEDKAYSSQYDPVNKTFIINHNIYGGGNACSTVNYAHVYMSKGMINATTSLGRTYEGVFFDQPEWREIYDKVGSSHFTVFGAGYGPKTVTGETTVDVAIDFDGAVEPTAGAISAADRYKKFKSYQGLLDVIGGGYNGPVTGDTEVHIGKNTFMRRGFGGGYFASVKKAVINVTGGNIDDVFAGGVIGDVLDEAYVGVGMQNTNAQSQLTIDGRYYLPNNAHLFIQKNVYGGNDVSGTVGASYDGTWDIENYGSRVDLQGGTIYGNVYGGGNGDYLYALAVNGETKVTPNEHYLKTNAFEGYDLVYTVPMREGMMSSSYASDPQKIVNINTYRPQAAGARIRMSGTEHEKLTVGGKVFGGGNSATIFFEGASPEVSLNIGDYVDIGGVFLGSDGDALFMDSEENPFLSNFQKINHINLEDSVVWVGDPANSAIETRYLPVEVEDRYKIYPHLLDLYFQPVEMNVQPVVLWNGATDGNVVDSKIGIFCCGGNRGNMNVYPAETGDNKGNVVDIQFPSGLTISKYIMGGCNNANYIWHNSATGNVTTHIGGYLLGERKSKNPMIKLLVNCQFAPTLGDDGEYHGGNVYGGCYKSGNIVGDVAVDFRSNMLKGLKTSAFTTVSDIGEGACNVYGAGYGTNSYVYGDTYVTVGKNTVCKTAVSTVDTGAKPAMGGLKANATEQVYNDTGTSASYIFGGGLLGNVVGNTNVSILNGHVAHSVTGGSYSGYMWGSTQVLVGYPEYYTVKEHRSGIYEVDRKDTKAENLAKITAVNGDDDGHAIKQKVRLLADDKISTTLYDAIVAKDPNKASYFQKTTTAPDVEWKDINIAIDEAVYGGGYSVASGTSMMANNTIVLKYTKDMNLDTETTTTSTVGYGGNTTVIAWDKLDYENGYVKQPVDADVDHVSISKQEMVKVDLENGTDMFGYYYKDLNGHYHYIYQENTYFEGQNQPKPANYDQNEGVFMTAYNFDAEGGMYGDGHLSFAEGFRTGELKGYGFSGGKTVDGARIMNSFQRMDILRLEDCNVIMLGARDFATNVTNTTPYSMSRIGELQMISKIDDSGELLPVKNIVQDDLLDGESNANDNESCKGARNFLGLSNNILYVGCVYTNTPFDDRWHDDKRKIGAADETYVSKKQDYIDRFYSDVIDEDEFQKRNDGTAKNMIGLSSGFAMKIQNVYNVEEDGDDNTFYGPISGVAEVNLLSARIDEGGGYVYADNVHTRQAGDNHAEDFLMTTGNFVFPHTGSGRYILDDCYVESYDKAKEHSHNLDEAHYWYIEGFNYFYQIHITGYTTDSSVEPIKFDSDNTDVLTIMRGAKKDQQVQLHSVTWRSNHPDDYDECDLDGYKKNADGTLDKTQPRMDNTKYILKLSAAEGSSYTEENSVYVNPITRVFNTTVPQNLTGTLVTDEPIISMQLEDRVDNRTEAYYNKHLSKPDRGTIVLTVPALKDDNTPIMRYLGVQNVFVYNPNSSELNKYVKVGANQDIDPDGTYYYYSNDTHAYEKLDLTKLYVNQNSNTDDVSQNTPITSLRTNENGLWVINGGANNEDGGSTTFYFYTTRSYTYTLYLTMEYVQGPYVNGHITINNCALPGEMIRLSMENVDHTADESMAPTGYYWRIGMRKQNADGSWSFADDTTWDLNTVRDELAKGYDTYKAGDTNGRGMFKGCWYDRDNNTLDVPVYYFMNGYGVQMGITFKGMGVSIFPVDMVTADSLLVHNYHRMSPHAENASIQLHLAEAAARVKASKEHNYNAEMAAYNEQKESAGFENMDEEGKAAWLSAHPKPQYVSPLNEPRVYIEDEEDLFAFYNFVDTVGAEGYSKKALVGKYEYDVPDGGEFVQFYLTDNLAFDKDSYRDKEGNALKYHTPSQTFKGMFDGLGHTVNFTNETHVENANTKLFGEVAGKVYNVGTLGRSIAQNLTAADPTNGIAGGTLTNCFTYGVKNKTAVPCVATYETGNLDNCYDLTNSADYDFKYGKVAYNLNQFYLAERKRRATNGAAVDGHIEEYYKNGDYRFVERHDNFTGKKTGVVYLRTTSNELPNYGSFETRHDKKHAIDEKRAVKTYYTAEDALAYNTLYNKEYSYEIDTIKVKEKDPVKKGDLKSVTYQPLFNESAVGEVVVADTIKNDYLLFGQNLTEIPDAYPSNIASRINALATNRVWRASGFYGTKKDEGYFFNAMTNYMTYVHDPRLTAVDFSCFRDGTINEDSYQTGWSSVSGDPTALQKVYYAPTKDTPADGAEDKTYWGFAIGDEGVTRNLLVYAKAATNINTIVSNADDVKYFAETDEADIKSHHVVVTANAASANLLHLVDKENFNAPIEFTASNAWYIRNPETETGYVESAGQGWESISLPFDVRTATLVTNDPDNLESGINQYYDYKDEQENSEHKRGTLKERKTSITFFYGGEADDVVENPNIVGHEFWLRGLNGITTDNTLIKGNFIRPVTGIDDVDEAGFKAYKPFVVSFPGSKFYEFDMTGQSLVFGATAAPVKVTDDAVEENKSSIKSGTSVYSYYGAYSNDEVDNKYAIELKSDADDASTVLGEKFVAGKHVYPFRGYMTVGSVSTGGAKAASYADFQEDAPEAIYISTLGIGLEEKGISEPETEEVIESNGMRIYPSGKRIVVESTYATTVNVYSANGKLVRVLDVRPGTSIFSGFATGIYVVEQKTMSLK